MDTGNLRTCCHGNFGKRLTVIGWSNKGGGAVCRKLNLCAVCRKAKLQTGCQTPAEVTAVVGRSHQQEIRRITPDQGFHRVGIDVGTINFIAIARNIQNNIRPIAKKLGGHITGKIAKNHSNQFTIPALKLFTLG